MPSRREVNKPHLSAGFVNHLAQGKRDRLEMRSQPLVGFCCQRPKQSVPDVSVAKVMIDELSGYLWGEAENSLIDLSESNEQCNNNTICVITHRKVRLRRLFWRGVIPKSGSFERKEK